MPKRVGIALVVAAIAALGVAAYWTYFDSGFWPSPGPGDSLGEIFVDSPEIYTRERLVNDRFREDAWLKEMLEVLGKEEAALQGFVRSSADERSKVGLNVQAGSAEKKSGDTQSAEGDAPSESRTNGSTAADPAVQTTLRDRFQSYADIRDTIRKQIVENQLDDRHDLSANTLYGFKFDMTVLPPGRDTSAWARITVTISGSDRSGPMQAGSTERLYRRWVSHLETVANQAYLEQNKPLLELAVDFKRTLLAFALSDEFSKKLEPDPGHVVGVGLDSKLEQVLSRLPDDNDPLSRLIAEWVIFDQISSRNLGQFVDASPRAVAGPFGRIVVKPKIGAAPIVPGGFEFEQLAAAPTGQQQSGLLAFTERSLDRAQTLFTYSVNPRVAAENFSDTGSYAATRELTSKLQASAEAANVDTAVDLARQLDTTIGAIRRNALIVGFSDSARADESRASAVFGWYIGPRFQLREDGRGHFYRQVPNQHALSALIALPAHWPEVKVTVQTEWIREDGSRAYQNQADSGINRIPQTGAAPKSHTYYVDLPYDPDKITAVLSIDSPKSETLRPIVYESQLTEDVSLRVGEEGSVLIPGRNLWRSTVVTIGPQQSDRITVLPNMEGIIAHYDPVDPVPEAERCADQVIRVWTSTGLATLKKPAHVCAPAAPAPPPQAPLPDPVALQ